MRRTATVGLVLLLGWVTGTARAEELQWRPAKVLADTGQSSSTAAVSTASKVQLGAPIPLGPDAQSQAVSASQAAPAAPGSRIDYFPVTQTSYVVRGQAPGGVPPVPPPPPPGAKVLGEENYNCGDVLGPGATQAPPAGAVGNLFSCITTPTGGRKCLQSDHCFDSFISPVTNPLLFEDPRALTEIRPVFIYQQTPTGNPIFHGGDIEHFSLQGRVALTDWLSITIHELGWTWMEPHNATPDFQTHAGFSEVQIGPKFTFWRNTTGGSIFGPSIAAAGLVFELPVGSHKVLQDTGWLSLRPYISYAQELFENPFGRFHFMTTAGYSLGIDNDRSDHLFLSAHLDFDVGKLQKIYPFIEMNYFLYTQNGHAQDVNFEGADLFNFGSRHVSGDSELSIALGSRYKFSEQVQLGGAIEFGLTGDRNLMDFRLVFDMIFRY